MLYLAKAGYSFARLIRPRSHLMEIPYDGNMLPGQIMIGRALLSQEMCKPIG